MFDLNKSIISLNCSNIINNLQYEYNDLKGNTVLKSNPPLGGLLCPFTKEDILKTAKAGCVIYDIIYDPLKTKLVLASEDRGLKTINGLRMNLIQAVLAYKYTNPTNLSIEQIFEKMNS